MKEKSTPIGLGAGFVLVFGAIAMGGAWKTYLDPVSLILVLGGSVAGLFVSFTMAEMKQVPKAIKALLGFDAPDYGALADQLAEYVRTARREGPLALDAQLGDVDDPILRSALEMAIDGTAPDRAAAMLRTQMAEAGADQTLVSRFMNKAASYAPAFGMIGTLVGLIQMLQNLNDPSSIGPAMAVAMITTFYGAFFANLIFLPMAAKAQGNLVALGKAHEMIRVATMGLLEGDPPSVVEQRLRLYVPGAAPAAGDDATTPLRKAA